MGKASVLDRYVQKVAMSGVTITLTHGAGQIPSKISSMWNAKEKIGMLIQRVNYIPKSGLMGLDAVGDQCKFGLCVVNAMPSTGFVIESAGCIDFNRLLQQWGTSVGGFQTTKIVQKDFKRSGQINGSLVNRVNMLLIVMSIILARAIIMFVMI